MIGKAIKKRREELGMKQEELALKIGVTPAAISNYEKDVSSPKESVMIKLFGALQCDANYLYQDYLPQSVVGFQSEEKKLIDLYESQPKIIKDVVKNILSTNYEKENLTAKQDTIVPPPQPEGKILTFKRIARKDGESDTVTMTQAELDDIMNQPEPDF